MRILALILANFIWGVPLDAAGPAAGISESVQIAQPDAPRAPPSPSGFDKAISWGEAVGGGCVALVFTAGLVISIIGRSPLSIYRRRRIRMRSGSRRPRRPFA